MRLLKYLKPHALAVFLVLVFLVCQAACELAVPTLTSNIVDIGIQQSGVEHVATEALSASTYEAICDELDGESSESPSELEFFKSSYDKTDTGNYELNDYGRENIEKLDDIVAEPLVSVYYETGADAAASATAATDATATAATDATATAATDASSELASQQAAAAAILEYERLGYDTTSIQMNYLLTTGLAMLGLSALAMVFSIATGFVASRTGAKIGRDLRKRIFERVVNFSSAEVGKFSAASLITRGTNDIQLVQNVCTMLMRMILYAPILGIGGIVMVLYTNAAMGWIIVVAVLAVLILVLVLFAVAMPKFKKMQKLIDRVNLVAREILSGLPVIRAFCRQPYEQRRFDTANTELMRTQLFTNRVMSFMMPTMTMVMNLTSVAIVWFGGFYIEAGTIQTGDLIAFITYSMVIIMGFLMIGMVAIMLPRAGVAAERIDEVLNTEPTIKDPRSPAALSKQTLGAQIEFENVSFRYSQNSEYVLEDVSFTVRSGQTLAIVGSTGSGKSTLLKLIERFYDVSLGSIKIDGIDIRELSQKDLRAQLGYVPQIGFLFSGTIDSNVAYADEGMPEDDVARALDIAQSSDFVSEKADGILSPIAQGGTNVSGGQRQRLCIARALASKPRAFLFDDSFSALDYKTDALLRASLKKNMGSATCIIVAQRISSVLDADEIIVLEEGKIVGSGTHAELMRSCVEYQEIAYSQLSAAELGLGGEAA